MSESIRPDIEFTRKVIAHGGADLKKCFQCATCSVTCPLSPDEAPFPRKEMIWAQWGAKDKLLADPDLWLCYQCNDCSVQCPRGARPGDVMAALRQTAIEEYAVPPFLGKAVQDPGWFTVLLAVPVVLFALLLQLGGGGVGEHWGWAEFANPSFLADGIVFDRFVPHWLIYSVFFPVSFLAVAAFAAGGARMWNAMKRSFPMTEGADTLVQTFKEILLHKHFDSCQDNRWRLWAHMGFVFGFILLAVTTAATIVLMYGLGSPPPLSFSPSHFFDGLLWKIVGNVGALILIGGCVYAVVRRASDPADGPGTSYADWSFLLVVLAVAVTGFGSQVLRLAAGSASSVAMAKAAYATYFTHLVFVFYLFLYAPYSKFAHLLYRTLALIYGKRAGRVASA